MESGSAPDGLGVICEFSATGADDRVEGVDVVDVLVDDRLVDESPQAFGGLNLGGVGRQEGETNAVGNVEACLGVPAGVVGARER